MILRPKFRVVFQQLSQVLTVTSFVVQTAPEQVLFKIDDTKIILWTESILIIKELQYFNKT